MCCVFKGEARWVMSSWISINMKTTSIQFCRHWQD
jgi:hypothetical protein